MLEHIQLGSNVMKLFCHFNEHERGDFGFLNTAMLLSDKVVLWGPSKRCIDSANAKGTLKIDASDLLDLVDAGNLQIVARENWFDKHWRQKASNQPGAWQGLAWDHHFDGTIANWSRMADDRVLTAPTETGFDWADSQIHLKSKCYYLAVERIENRLLPNGLIDKLSQVDDRETKIKLVLRDARNHLLAKNFAKAIAAIEPDQGSVGFGEIATDFEQNFPGTPDSLSPNKIGDMLRVVASLTTGLSLKDLKTQIEEIKPYRKEFSSLIYSNKSFKEELLSKIKDNYTKKEVIDMLGNDFFESGLTFISLISGVLTAQQSRELINRRDLISFIKFGITATSLVGTAYSPAREIARSNSFIRAQYDGPKFPFALVFQTDRPSQFQVEHLLKIIANIPEIA